MVLSQHFGYTPTFLAKEKYFMFLIILFFVLQKNYEALFSRMIIRNPAFEMSDSACKRDSIICPKICLTR